MSSTKKPVGVIAIAIYGGLGGLFSTLGGAGLMIMSSSITEFPFWIHAMAVVSFVFGIGLLFSIFGLLTLKSWGWTLTNILYAVSIPLGALSVFPIYPDSEFSISNVVMQLISIGLAAFILVYIRKPHVKPLYC